MPRILFRLRVRRLGREWKDWVEHEIARPSFLVWAAIGDSVAIVVTVAVIAAFTEEVPVLFGVVWLAVRLASTAFPRARASTRDASLGHHRKKWNRQGRREAPAP